MINHTVDVRVRDIMPVTVEAGRRQLGSRIPGILARLTFAGRILLEVGAAARSCSVDWVLSLNLIREERTITYVDLGSPGTRRPATIPMLAGRRRHDLNPARVLALGGILERSG